MHAGHVEIKRHAVTVSPNFRHRATPLVERLSYGHRRSEVQGGGPAANRRTTVNSARPGLVGVGEFHARSPKISHVQSRSHTRLPGSELLTRPFRPSGRHAAEGHELSVLQSDHDSVFLRGDRLYRRPALGCVADEGRQRAATWLRRSVVVVSGFDGTPRRSTMSRLSVAHTAQPLLVSTLKPRRHQGETPPRVQRSPQRSRGEG